jgi:AraC family transcriptional regulator, transcriptional activator of pobA
MKYDYATVQDEHVALHDRTLRSRMGERFSTLLYLPYGALYLPESADENIIEGPALLFWPAGQRPDVVLRAGSQASILCLSDALLLDAVGSRAESLHLRIFVEHPFVVPVPMPEAAGLIELNTLIEAFKAEALDETRRSPMALYAHLRLVLIGALRLHQPLLATQSRAKTGLLHRFRHLVEMHYREQWRLSRYVAELGVDYDRLHHACKRETGLSPAELVHERLTHEAKARLEASGFPLKRIAADLGFADATRFSHYFKRRTDMSPGAYRALAARPGDSPLPAFKRGFSDWP